MSVAEIEARIEKIESIWEGRFAPHSVIRELDRLVIDDLPAALLRERIGVNKPVEQQ